MSRPIMKREDERVLLKLINRLKKDGFDNAHIAVHLNDNNFPSLTGKDWNASSASGFWSSYRQTFLDLALDDDVPQAQVIISDSGELESKYNFLQRENDKLSKVLGSIRGTIADDDSAEITVKLIKKVLEFA